MVEYTSARNAANVVKLVTTWQCTGEVTQTRNRLNVLFVVNDSQRLVRLLSTAELTVQRSRIRVTNVRDVFRPAKN